MRMTIIQDQAPTLPHDLARIPRGLRGATLQAVATFCPNPRLEAEFEVGVLRASFADYWEKVVGTPMPIQEFRKLLAPPVPVAIAIAFSRLNVVRDENDLAGELQSLVHYLARHIDGPTQLSKGMTNHG